MTSDKKFRITAIAGILILILLLSAQQCQLNRQQKELELKNIKISTLSDSVNIFRDKNDHLTFRIQAIQVEESNNKEALKQAGWDIKDLRARNIRANDVISALRSELVASGSGTITLHDTIHVAIHDTVRSLVGSWSNNFLSIYPRITGKQMDFSYKYQTGIDVLSTQTHKGTTVINIALQDTSAHITTGNAIIFRQPRKWYNNRWLWFGLGAAGGVFLAK